MLLFVAGRLEEHLVALLAESTLVSMLLGPCISPHLCHHGCSVQESIVQALGCTMLADIY